MPADLTQAWLLANPRKPDPASSDPDATVATTSADVGFPEKVLMAVLKTARSVRSEAPPTQGTANEWRKRQELAANSIADPKTYSARFAALIATMTSIDGTSTDTVIVNAVQQSWNAVANVRTDEGTVS
jgi:hypothetical protein